MKIIPTNENIAKLFTGVMIPVRDFPSGIHIVPGWKCKACGYIEGASGLPMPHECPDAGDHQLKQGTL